MAEDRSSRTELSLLLLFLTSLLAPCHTLSLPVTGCKNLCSINQTTDEDNGKCFQSCLETLEKFGDDVREDKGDLVPGTSKSSEVGSGFMRVARSDANQFIGPYQRRPHYLRIGRSGMSSDDLKRARPSHYVRIGRSYSDDISADEEEFNEDKRGRPSHYLRIGRGSDEQETLAEELNKRAKPSHYLRIGRSSDEEESLAMGEEFNKRARPAHYLRIGRGVSTDDGLIEEEPEKRARPAHYLRIGRGVENLAEEKEKRARPAHYLRIGRDSAEGLSKPYSVEAMNEMSPYLAVYPLIKRDAKRPYRQSHYLRIGRS